MYFGLIGFGVLVGLLGILIGLVIQILFLLNLMRLLQAVHPYNRAMSPGLVWLNLIPVFSLGWMIYTVIKIKDSVRRENAARWGSSVNEGNTHTVGLLYAVLAAAAFVFSYGGYANRGVSVFGGLISLAVFILWIIYWVKTARLKRELERTAGQGYGPGGPYGPGGQYGTGGPYSYGGPGYEQGAPGYGQGGPAYGPAPGPGQAGYPGFPPPDWQPPASTPPSGEEPPASAPPSGEEPSSSAPQWDYWPSTPQSQPEPPRSCSLCGRKLDPNDQFCASCGTPVPKR